MSIDSDIIILTLIQHFHQALLFYCHDFLGGFFFHRFRIDTLAAASTFPLVSIHGDIR